jgi:hypothetical protein
MIPVSEQAKTVHALDRSATVTRTSVITILKSKVNIGEVLVMGGVGYKVFVDKGEVKCLHIRQPVHYLQLCEKG